MKGMISGRRFHRQALSALFILVAAGAAVTASDTVELAAAETGLTERIERAVVIGSEIDLREIQQMLDGRVDAEDVGTIGFDDYNLAYVNWRLSQLLDPERKKEKRRLLKAAQKRIEERLERVPDEAESLALRGSAIGEQIGGFFRGMFLGPKATKSLNRAFELDPDGPRVALQRAISYYYTPKSFGGGLDRAEQEVRRARDLFDLEPADHPWPNWGRLDALAWLGQILQRRGKPEEARVVFEAALSLEPEYAWIREELLPALVKEIADADEDDTGSEPSD